jgi:hypothetical protein
METPVTQQTPTKQRGPHLDLPVCAIDLQHEEYWMPTDQRGRSRGYGRFMKLWRWGHIALGWILSALFVAGITGLIKKE